MDDFEKELKIGFLEEAAGLIADAEQCFLHLEKEHENPSTIEKIFRLAHNLKGSAGAVGFQDLAKFTHTLESLLLKVKNKEKRIDAPMIDLLLACNDRLNQIVSGLKADLEAKFDNTDLLSRIENDLTAQPREPPPPPNPAPEPMLEAQNQPVIENTKEPALPAPKDESIRVRVERIDRLMNNVGELVILQTVLTQHKSAVPSEFLQKTIAQLEKISREIRDISMTLRMIPIKQEFQKMQRIVRDTSQSLGKEITFQTAGEETEIDKTVLEQINDPLVHLVRNAVDHGVESAAEREAAGKPRHGCLSLTAYHRGEHVVVEVRDDGRGLDPAKLKAKAIEKGLIKPEQTLSDKEALELIFAPGFSTKTEVSDISGRGVGLDVVKTNISRLKGQVQIETALGSGTCFRILLPLTLAIIDGMVVSVDNERFVIPVSNVHESIRPKQNDIARVTERGELLNLRGETMPLLRLDKLLGKNQGKKNDPWNAIAIIVRAPERRPFSILVDDILGKQQVVIRPLGEEIRGMGGVAGGAILGDGHAALILDLNAMLDRAAA